MFPCPCCGYLVFAEKPGSYEICPICFWEDDVSQLRFPTMGGGANRPSLREAQATFAEIGAIEERFLGHVRALTVDDQRDLGWHPLDVVRDEIQVPRSGVEYGETYPSDLTTLYYWRRSAG